MFTRKTSVISIAIMVIIMIIGLVLYFQLSWQGYTEISVGKLTDVVRLDEINKRGRSGKIQLPFSIRLDSIDSYSTAEYKIIQKQNDFDDNPHDLNRNDETAQESQDQVIGEFPLEEGKIFHLEGTDFNFRLNEFFPDFGFVYDYPDKIDTILPADPGIMMELVIGSNKSQLQLRKNENDRFHEAHINASLEFSWERPKALEYLLLRPNGERTDSSLARIVFCGKNEEVIFEFSNWAFSQKLEKGKTYMFPGNDRIGFIYQFVFPDAKYIQATMTNREGSSENPVAKVEIWNPEEVGSKLSYLYPDKRSRVGKYEIPGSSQVLALVEESNVHFTIDLSILEPSGNISKQFRIESNDTVDYEGHRLYQMNQSNKNDNLVLLGISKTYGCSVLVIGIVGFFISLMAVILQFRPISS